MNERLDDKGLRRNDNDDYAMMMMMMMMMVVMMMMMMMMMMMVMASTMVMVFPVVDTFSTTKQRHDNSSNIHTNNEATISFSNPKQTLHKITTGRNEGRNKKETKTKRRSRKKMTRKTTRRPEAGRKCFKKRNGSTPFPDCEAPGRLFHGV